MALRLAGRTVSNDAELIHEHADALSLLWRERADIHTHLLEHQPITRW